MIKDKSRKALLAGFADAQYAWAAFFSDKSATAPFPVEWLPRESTCDMALESAIQSATTFTKWSADLGSVVAAPSPEGAASKSPKASNSGSADELEKLKTANKRLREELARQQDANKKTKGSPAFLQTCYG